MKELNLTEELIEKANKARTVEELLLFAKENGLELTNNEARDYFTKLNPKIGQLEDEELENVNAGGACDYKEPICKCGSKNFKTNERHGDMGLETEYTCLECGRYWLL